MVSTSKRLRVLITGSSGQIGTNLGLALLERGNQVIGGDVRPNEWTDKIPTLPMDFRKPIPPESFWPITPDVVVHLAAHAKVHELVENPARALENVVMTFNVLEYCRANGLPLIFSSSREVYGDIHRFLTEESYADFNYAESPYSASKLSGEALIYSYARCYGLRYLVFRFSNVYGRYDNDLARMERVIPLFMRKIAAGEPITVYGAKKTLDFTYVDDCVAGVTAGIDLLAAGEAVNETVNLAYGKGHTLAAMAWMIGDALGVKPRMTIEESRPGEVTHYVANIGKARALLGYEPQVPLEEGIRRAVEWVHEYTEQRGTNPAGHADPRRHDPVPQTA